MLKYIKYNKSVQYSWNKALELKLKLLIIIFSLNILE